MTMAKHKRKLSPHYRLDSTDGVDIDLRAKLDEIYLKKLENLHVSNPKICIVFSAGAATGKSTVAQKIAAKYNGLLLENDAIKRAILEFQPDMHDKDRLNLLAWQYSMDLYRRLDSLTQNGLVIRDGVIDWYYDRILPIFQEKGYRLFIIAIRLSTEKNRKIILERGGTPTARAERLIELLDDQAIHQARFGAEFAPNVILEDDTVFDHHIVMDAFGEFMKEVSEVSK